MKILAISDLFVPATVMREALGSLHPDQLHVVEWSNRDRSQLHQRIRQIEQHGPGAVPPPDQAWPLAAEADLIVTHLCPLSSELIQHAKELKMIGVCRGGTDTIACDKAQERGIPILSVPGRNAVAVAEFTIGLILAERRNIGRAHGAIRSGTWRKEFYNIDQETELAGKTVGILGFGSIGQLVVERLTAFDVEILVHDPFPATAAIEQLGGKQVALDLLLGRSDVLSLHARADAGQPPLIGARELALMKPTSYLINTARARLVDQQALVQALQQKQIAGAALDVFDKEPLDADSPLRQLDNVTLTPHLAGSTQEAFHGSPFRLVETIHRHTARAGGNGPND